MIRSKTVVTALRLLALAGTVVGFVLAMWSLVIVQAINSSRGQKVFQMLDSTLGVSGPSWTRFIAAASQSILQMWILIVASLTTTSMIMTVIISNRYYWLRISSPVALLLLEATSTVFVIPAFACALSLSLTFEAWDTRPLPTFQSTDLSFFSTLITLSKGLTITTTISLGLLLTTLTVHLITFLRHRAHVKDTRSFEPTVSALGMSHGFHALHPPPRPARPSIPTMYDPYRAFRKGPGAQQPWALPGALAYESSRRTEALRSGASTGRIVSMHVGFADEGTWISRKSDSRWSVSTASPRRVEGDIMRLLEIRKVRDLKRSRRAVSVRPVSAAWYGEVVHAY